MDKKTDRQEIRDEPDGRPDVGRLMDDFFADFYRRKREAGKGGGRKIKHTPEGFDPRAFDPAITVRHN